jgi:hypothetical protein
LRFADPSEDPDYISEEKRKKFEAELEALNAATGNIGKQTVINSQEGCG